MSAPNLKQIFEADISIRSKVIKGSQDFEISMQISLFVHTYKGVPKFRNLVT